MSSQKVFVTDSRRGLHQRRSQVADVLKRTLYILYKKEFALETSMFLREAATLSDGTRGNSMRFVCLHAKQ